MPFVQAKCPECGGMLAVDDSKKAANCQFCGKAFIVQDAVNNYNTYNTYNTNHNYGEGAVVNVYENQNSVSSLLKRAFMFLEDCRFSLAHEYFDKALDINPENAQAYLGKLMADLWVCNKDELQNCSSPFDNNNNYKKILRFGDIELKEYLQRCINLINNRNDNIRLEREHQEDIARKEFEQKRVAIDNLILQKREQCFIFSPRISADKITVGLKSNGTIVVAGKNDSYQHNISNWTNIIAISVGSDHTVGLKSNGTVIATGSNYRRQCNVSNWTDIIAISAGSAHTVGLKSDGTVVATKGKTHLSEVIDLGSLAFDNSHLQVENWAEIIAISAGQSHTVGLKADGTVVAVGKNNCGQCNVSNWTDIIAISAGGFHTVGLKSNGTVVATDVYNYGASGQCNVSNWTDIVAVFAGWRHTIGLKSDGTVVATEYTGDKKFYKGQGDVGKWTDIIAISAGAEHTVGLKKDGTVVTTEYTGDKKDCDGRCDVEKWKLF